MADFGGVLKNQSIGVASADGKAQPGDDEKPLIERINR